MKNLKILSIALLAIFSACGPKSKDSKEVAIDQNEAAFESKDDEKDAKFAVTVADVSNLEVQLGKLARTHAASAKVKEYGQMMIDDHGKASTELKDIASKKDITLPEALSEDHQKEYNDLASKKGKDFDKAYCNLMVRGHKDAIDLFTKEADKGNDPDLQSWAAGKIAVLEHHLQMARECDEAVARMR